MWKFRPGQKLENSCIVVWSIPSAQHTENSGKHAANLRYNDLSASKFQNTVASLRPWEGY
jgi:hypothetical protein